MKWNFPAGTWNTKTMRAKEVILSAEKAGDELWITALNRAFRDGSICNISFEANGKKHELKIDKE